MAATRGTAFSKAFGLRLRTSRKHAGLSQRELAERAGIAEKYLSRVEVGAAVPSIRVARDLAAALGVNLDALADGKTTALDARLATAVRVLQRLAPEDLERAVRVLRALR